MRWLLAFTLGVWVALMAVASYYALEWALQDYADYERGLWEGAAVVVVMNGCNTFARYALKRSPRQRGRWRRDA